MKILTKEEEAGHYNATLKGGITGGVMGLALGSAAVWGASKRFHAFRQLTIPMRTFLATSAGTFAAIISADRASRSFEFNRDPSRRYKDNASRARDEVRAAATSTQRLKEWARANRYPIVAGSWVASMGAAFALVGRNPYLTGAQKLVQARVYAQGLTLAVLVITAVLETSDASQGKGHWETVRVLDPKDPTHQHMIEKKIHHESYAGQDLWRDMVEAEEQKLEARDKAVKEQEAKDQAASAKSSPPARVSEKDGKTAAAPKNAGSDNDDADAHRKEEAKMAKQKERLDDARTSAVADSAKVKDRNEYQGR